MAKRRQGHALAIESGDVFAMSDGPVGHPVSAVSLEAASVSSCRRRVLSRSRAKITRCLAAALRTRRYAVRVVGVLYPGQMLREPLTIFWDKRQRLPRYGTGFCEMFTPGHVRLQRVVTAAC
jgi:hypothetical protein